MKNFKNTITFTVLSLFCVALIFIRANDLKSDKKYENNEKYIQVFQAK